MSDFSIIIPARLGSTRLKNKPLVNLGDHTLIEHVLQNSQKISSNSYVATDSLSVVKKLNHYAEKVILTSNKHKSGTDRVFEAASRLNFNDENLIINLQGDEPFVPKDLILKMVNDFNNHKCDVITASSFLKEDDLKNPNCVKVKTTNGFADKFFRLDSNEKLADSKRHIGIYGYSFKTLSKFVLLNQSKNEIDLKLEQFRFLDNNFSIYVTNYLNEIPHGVDTAEDLKNANMYLDKQ